MAEKIDVKRIKKIIFDFLFDLIYTQLNVETDDISFYVEKLAQAIAKEIGGKR